MTALKAHQVARFAAHPDLKAGIFLAYGPDGGLVREIGQRLINYYAAKDGDAANIIVLDNAELDADPAILAIEAKTVSLFGGQQIIRVRSATKSIVSTLAALLDDPGNAVIVLEAGNLTPKDALRALVDGSKLGRALPCYPDSDETLTALFRETFAQNNIRVDGDVIQTLKDILGNDREVTRRELEKLTLYAASSKELTRQEVLQLCADNGATIVDAIIDAMGTGYPEKFEIALGRALNSGVDPQRLLRSAAMHFAQLRLWRTQVDAGKSPRDTLATARPKPHFSRLSAVEKQLRLWSDPALAAACARLHQATSDTRRQPNLAETILKRTLLALCMLAATR